MDVNSDFVGIFEKMDEKVKSDEEIIDLELEVKIEKPDATGNIKTEVFKEKRKFELPIIIGEKRNNQEKLNKKIKIEFAENTTGNITPITVVIGIKKFEYQKSIPTPTNFALGKTKTEYKKVKNLIVYVSTLFVLTFRKSFIQPVFCHLLRFFIPQKYSMVIGQYSE